MERKLQWYVIFLLRYYKIEWGNTISVRLYRPKERWTYSRRIWSDRRISSIKKSPYSNEGPCDPFLLYGSRIIEGAGSLLVVAVGKHSQSNKKAKLMRVDIAKFTPLKKKLQLLIQDIAKVGLPIAILTLSLQCSSI